jgi:K+/H+ antiporter YhaU regulatory subunit KhtT
VRADLERALELGRSRLEAYGVGTLEAQATVIERRRGLGLRDADVETLAVDVPPASRAVGRTIAELGLGRGALIVAIVRDQRLIVPAGSLQLAAGDRLLLIADREARLRIGEAF